MSHNKQSKGCRSILIFLFLLLVLIGVSAFVGYKWYNDSITGAPSANSEDVVLITIPEGATLTSVSPELESKGLIKSDLALKIYLRVNSISPNIKPGEYKISKNNTLESLITILEKGTVKNSIWVTLREGLRPEQAAEILDQNFSKVEDEKRFNIDEYLDIVNNPTNYTFSTAVNEFLKLALPSDKYLIGFLYPDTYNFEADSTAIVVIEKQISTLMERLKENQIDLANFNATQETPTFYDALILASIIEKEAGGNDDRSLISSVFHNRLSVGMRLESDATINFFTKRDDPRSTIAETQIDNPYNTYFYTGLTPTPINNPGIASIKAAIYPTESEYVFFRHDRSGKIYFSKTLQEHSNYIYLYP